ncbi:hypothetical protein EK21DRAFT_117951 [Setomelanomma holmii]|uniref:Ubiquitin-like protease family profile domain-containing protein n=1 Tax=Setomelanomma holmii TaxID=210430 RepID=A0A9P4GYA1_9PLEO|nr:hypothetical protein EK21DRAFT_117951 [Setomelanomma holmii]
MDSQSQDSLPSLLQKDIWEHYGLQRTPPIMRAQFRTMDVTAARGFKRERFVPTRPTSRPLLSRRYTIDVTTAKNWGTTVIVPLAVNNGQERIQPINPRNRSHQLEPVPLPMSLIHLPYPFRYPDFMVRRVWNPPYDYGEYLTLGDAKIRNDEFLNMRRTDGADCWMGDAGLDMALEALRRSMECESHKIDILSTTFAQMSYMSCGYDDAVEASYDCFRVRFSDKRWIFVPVNNGTAPDRDAGAAGSHWALAALDRVHKRAYYYDSLFNRGRPSDLQIIAQTAIRGLLHILHEDEQQWEWSPQKNSPHQWWNNRFDGDLGPCGPFVWYMCKILIDHVVRYQLAGEEEDCSIELNARFPHRFGRVFDSFDVREDMQRLILDYKTRANSQEAMELHDTWAVEGGSVELSAYTPDFIFPTARNFLDCNLAYLMSEPQAGGGIELSAYARHHRQISSSISSGSTISNSSSTKTEPAKEIELDTSEDWVMTDVKLDATEDEEMKDILKSTPPHVSQTDLPHRPRIEDANYPSLEDEDLNDPVASAGPIKVNHSASTDLDLSHTPTEASHSAPTNLEFSHDRPRKRSSPIHWDEDARARNPRTYSKRTRQNSNNWSLEGGCGRV